MERLLTLSRWVLFSPVFCEHLECVGCDFIAAVHTPQLYRCISPSAIYCLHYDLVFFCQFRMSISFLLRFEPPPMCVYVDKLSFQAIESLWF